jgi:glycine/D-amino acid oxidase-like deaminating enzyme
MHPTVFERQPPRASVVEHALAGAFDRPFWLDDRAAPAARPPLRGEIEADLVVVGGGFLGLWSALHAKERHPERRVVLLESHTTGWAASGRNGGFCEASLTHGDANGQRRWPEEMAQLDAMGLANLDAIEAALKRHGIDCDFERTGTLAVAVEPHQVAWLRDEPGYLDGTQMRAEIDSPTYLAGAWDREGCALLHPGKLTGGLAAACERLGVEIFEHSAATGLDERGDRVAVATAQGRVSARRVLLATNAFPSLLKRWRLHTIPVYDYVLMTEPLSTAQLGAIGWRNRQGVADMANQFHYYRLTRDQRILFGGYDAIYHFGGKVNEAYEQRPASFRRLASHFFTTFPQLEGLRFSHRWSGVIDTSTRFCAFYAGAMGGKLAYGAGFTGLGVGATHFAAEVLLDRLDGLDTERTRLRMVREMPLPFPPEPIAYAAVQTMRHAMDRADHNLGRRGLLLRTADALGLGFDS